MELNTDLTNFGSYESVNDSLIRINTLSLTFCIKSSFAPFRGVGTYCFIWYRLGHLGVGDSYERLTSDYRHFT